MTTFDFSYSGNPVATAPMALRVVYTLHADPTYDTLKRGVQNTDFVALRTVGGTGKVLIEGYDEITVLPGTLMFFEHDKVRRYYCGGINWDFWWFEFAINDKLNLPLNRPIEIETVENESGDCNACLELLRKSGAEMTPLASATFSVLLYKWLLHIQSGRQAPPHEAAVENAINYMKQNMDKPLSIENLARTAGLCERRFRQVFSSITGMPPKKFQETLRIGTAEQLLLNTPCSINEISMRLGFSSQFHFCKAFRSVHGLPPSQYRANGR